MLVLAPCSSKKSVPVSAQLDASSIRVPELRNFADTWVTRVRAETATYPSSNVYCGAGISAATRATELIQAELHVVSAGLALVGPNSLIPGYNLTVGDDGPSPLRIVQERCTLHDWWEALNRAFGHQHVVKRLVEKHDGVVILALPESYLQMIEQELVTLEPKHQKRLRLITSQSARFSPALEPQAIRFDQRLNILPEAPGGANASFVQRALLFFAQLQLGNPRIRAVATQRILVQQALSSVDRRPPPDRKRLSDREIGELIMLRIRLGQTSPWRQLEKLRKSDGVACEQKRFLKIFEQISDGLCITKNDEEL